MQVRKLCNIVVLTKILFLLNNIYANQIPGQSTCVKQFIFASSTRIIRIKNITCKNNRIYSRYADGYLNADDICTLATNPSTLEAQISMVTKFTEENFLKLNASKAWFTISRKTTRCVALRSNAELREIVNKTCTQCSATQCSATQRVNRKEFYSCVATHS